ncbi:MAG: CotH kinase family protein, partial [Bacteroidales bacterium]|nr:CotH kinase family protein [Bacteroidales bacterium]
MKHYNFHITRVLFSLLLAGIVLLSSCRADDILEETEVIINRSDLSDWSTETHSDSVSPNYDVVFAQQEVLRIDINFSSDDWDDMQDDLASILSSNSGPGTRPGEAIAITSDPMWVPCSIFFNDKQWYNVGIRYKGNSSLQSTYQSGNDKLPFKLDFDEFEEDYPEIQNQRFYGFKQLNLKNNYIDASMIREKVASDLFMDFGLASPQTSFCVVYVDYGSGPIYYGVYTLVEEVDDTVLGSQFNSEEGNLYKPDGDAATFGSGTYDDSEMEKKNNEELADYSDVYALYSALNSAERTSDEEQWKSQLNTVLDVDVLMKWLAANTVMQNWDTYGNMTHNYYLYNNPDNGLLTWIPWDNNEALQSGKQKGALSLSLDEVGSTWPLIRYI